MLQKKKSDAYLLEILNIAEHFYSTYFQAHQKVAFTKIICNSVWKFTQNGVDAQAREENKRLQCVDTWSTRAKKFSNTLHKHKHKYTHIRIPFSILTIQFDF